MDVAKIVILLSCISPTLGELDESEIDVWEFRIQDLSNNSKVKAFYSTSAPQWEQDLKEYTLCFRYRLHYATPENIGISTIAVSATKEYHWAFEISTDVPNAIQLESSGANQDEDHLIFYQAKVPIRQWITLCIVKRLEDRTFRIINNGVPVYSYNECLTSAEVQGSGEGGRKVDNVPCYDGHWTLKNGQVPEKKIGLCSDTGNRYHYWCPVTVNETTSKFHPEKDQWGYCALSCTDMTNIDNDIMATKPLPKDLFNNLEFGAEEESSRTFKGKISDVNIWNYVLSENDLNDYAFCKNSHIYKHARVSWNNNTKYWTLVKDGNALEVARLPRWKLCRRENSTFTYGFTKPMDFEKSLKLCSSLNGYLPLPKRYSVFTMNMMYCLYLNTILALMRKKNYGRSSTVLAQKEGFGLE